MKLPGELGCTYLVSFMTCFNTNTANTTTCAQIAGVAIMPTKIKLTIRTLKEGAERRVPLKEIAL